MNGATFHNSLIVRQYLKERFQDSWKSTCHPGLLSVAYLKGNRTRKVLRPEMLRAQKLRNILNKIYRTEINRMLVRFDWTHSFTLLTSIYITYRMISETSIWTSEVDGNAESVIHFPTQVRNLCEPLWIAVKWI